MLELSDRELDRIVRGAAENNLQEADKPMLRRRVTAHALVFHMEKSG